MPPKKPHEVMVPKFDPDFETKMVEEFFPEWKEKIKKRYSPTTAERLLTLENCRKDWIIIKLGINKPTLM
jgi:hypothetical protein